MDAYLKHPDVDFLIAINGDFYVSNPSLFAEFSEITEDEELVFFVVQEFANIT